MTELFEALAAGLLWALVFVLLALALRQRIGTGDAVLAAYAIFFAAQVMLANAFDRAGLLNTPAFRLVYVAAAVVGVLLLVRRGAARIRPVDEPARDPETLRVRRITFAIVCVTLAAVMLFTLISPVHVWDVLAYHMPMVASYIQNASLDAWPTQDLRQIYRVNAGELQMLNVALLARSDAWVELPNALGLLVVLVASFEIARLALRRTAFPYLAVLLVITAPQIVIGTTTAKNDLVFTAVLLCSFYWMIRGGLSSGRETWLWMLLAGLSAAIAAATKVMGLNVVGAVGVLALVLVVRRRIRFAHVLAYGTSALVCLLLLAGHIYLGNLGRSAVPVGIAPGEIHYSVGLVNLTEAVEYYAFDLTLKRLGARPVLEHDFMHYGYLFPFMLVFGVAAMFVQLRERRYVTACLALLATTLFVSVIAIRRPISWDQRFMIWLVPTLAILALLLAERLSARRVLQLTAAAVVLAAGNVAIALVFESDDLFRRSAAHLVATGSLARPLDVPNRRYLYMRDGLDALDQAAAPRDSILYAGTDDSWMYPLWGGRFTRHVEGVWNADHAAAQVASRSFPFVVVEAEAQPEIRAAAEAQARASGYDILWQSQARNIFVRNDGTSSARAID